MIRGLVFGLGVFRREGIKSFKEEAFWFRVRRIGWGMMGWVV